MNDGYGFWLNGYESFYGKRRPKELREDTEKLELLKSGSLAIQIDEFDFGGWTPLMVYELLRDIFEEKHSAQNKNACYNIEPENKDREDCFFCGEKLKVLKVCKECDKKPNKEK